MSIKKVVGISYQPEDGLPRVIVKASGEMASTVEHMFRQQHLKHRVVKDEGLVNSLFRLPMESEISADLYQLVAMLLVHVYSVEAKLKDMAKND